MNILLLILSIIIYMSFGISNFLFIFFSAISTFYLSHYLNTKYKKGILAFTIIINLIILLVFKLYKFIPNNNISLVVPLGISYYTLQVISYVIDVYRGKIESEYNLFHYLIYVTYIPHLFIGPIYRYSDVKKEIEKPKKIKIDNIYNGSTRVLWGLYKKLLIATRTQMIINTISTNNYTGFYVLYACLLYSIMLYADFSGGIDIVLGISKVLDIDIKENFNSPFLSQSVKEFWNRWHISLSSWLKDYIYIPLGGNRKGKIRKGINVLITFFISGIWHGVNHIIWGLLNGIFVLFGGKYTKFKPLNIFITFILISLLWIFFIYDNNITSLNMLKTIITNFNFVEFINNVFKLGINTSDYIILIISMLSLVFHDIYKDKINNIICNTSYELRTVLLCSFIIIILVFGIYGIGFKIDDFVYSKF